MSDFITVQCLYNNNRGRDCKKSFLQSQTSDIRRQRSPVKPAQLNGEIKPGKSVTERCGLFNHAAGVTGSKNKESSRLLISELFIARLFAGASE